MKNEALESLSREQLLTLLELSAKNWLALDGVWFQSVERKYGMDEAMYHDIEAWRRFTEIEARRIKQFLGLPEQPGLEGLAQALPLRLSACNNAYELQLTEHTLVYRVLDCRVQTARTRKGMALHPCRSVGLVEYAGFASVIDTRIACRCLSCYPDIKDSTCACSWEFTLESSLPKGTPPAAQQADAGNGCG